MSQQFLRTASERDCYNSPSLVADHHENHQGFDETFQNAYAVPFHEPAVDHHGALLPRVAASTNGNLPLAQPEHDAGTQYPAEYPWQANPWNAAALDVYRPGSFNLNAGLHDESLNLSYGEFHPEPAFSIALMAPAWDFNCIQDFDQSNIPIGSAAQLNEASYPGMVSATPAQAPAPAAANRIRCPHGCPATFGRGGEYRRHMMIHEPARYRCPMVDCPKTFSRADKLRDHAKRGHGGRNPLRL